MKIERADIPRVGLGEGAVWDHDDQALYFLDIFGRRLHRHDPVAGTTHDWILPGQVGAMALREGGAFLAMPEAFHDLDFATGETRRLGGPVFSDPRITVNDGAADRRGRFVFGGCSAGLDDPQPVGGLYVTGADYSVIELDRGICQSNSHCFTPDGRTLYAADSFVTSIYAYDYDLDTGTVANKRLFANTSELGGCPDGSAVDADGMVWMTIFPAGKIAAFRSDGKLERVIDMPVKLVSSVAWGGTELDKLYVTTIDPTQFGWEAEAGSGHVYVIEDLGSRGVPEAKVAL